LARHAVTLLPGDGVGPEICEAAVRVLEATGVEFDWDIQPAGESAMKDYGSPLPQQTLDSIRKTLVALSFLVDGARRGEPGLMVSWEESPAQLMRSAQAFGWNPEELRQDKLLDVLHVSPAQLTIERHAVELIERAQQVGARRIVIDSITAIAAAVPEVATYRYYLWAITDYCKRWGITVIMTAEADGPVWALKDGTRGLTFVADTIIVLRYVEVEGDLKRAVGVLKMRGSGHDTSLHELLIDPPHLAVGPRLAAVNVPGAALHSL